jgi:hypothetical protein
MLQLETIPKCLGKLWASTPNQQEVDGAFKATSPLIALFSTRPTPTSASEKMQYSWPAGLYDAVQWYPI